MSRTKTAVDITVPMKYSTPDGLIDDDGIVEIKCPFSAAKVTPEEGILI